MGDFLYPDRIALGVKNQRCAAMLREVYEALNQRSYYSTETPIPGPVETSAPPPIVVTSAKSAELIKQAVGADVQQVCEGIRSDSRIGRKFLHPGIGYNGSCFSKDRKAFPAVAEESGYDFRLLEEVRRMNQGQLQRCVRKVRGALRGKRLGLLGLASKGGTDDVREPPAIAVAEALLKEGCVLQAYDLAATEQARAVLPAAGVTYVSGPHKAAASADARLILTDWEEFYALELEPLRSARACPITVDGGNFYDPATTSVCSRLHLLQHWLARRCGNKEHQPRAEQR